jgi:hypothetical protein
MRFVAVKFNKGSIDFLRLVAGLLADAFARDLAWCWYRRGGPLSNFDSVAC